MPLTRGTRASLCLFAIFISSRETNACAMCIVGKCDKLYACISAYLGNAPCQSCIHTRHGTSDKKNGAHSADRARRNANENNLMMANGDEDECRLQIKANYMAECARGPNLAIAAADDVSACEHPLVLELSILQLVGASSGRPFVCRCEQAVPHNL